MSGKKIFFSTKRSKNGPKNIPKKTGNFLDWDFGIWPKRDGFRDILDLYCFCPKHSRAHLAILHGTEETSNCGFRHIFHLSAGAFPVSPSLSVLPCRTYVRHTLGLRTQLHLNYSGKKLYKIQGVFLAVTIFVPFLRFCLCFSSRALPV